MPTIDAGIRIGYFILLFLRQIPHRIVVCIATPSPEIKQVDRGSVRGDCINRMVGDCAGLSAIARARRAREEIERVIGVCSLGGYARRNKKRGGNQNCYEAFLAEKIFSARYSAKRTPPPVMFFSLSNISVSLLQAPKMANVQATWH